MDRRDALETSAAVIAHARLESIDLVRGVIFVVVAMYPLCRWFTEIKRRRTDARLSYL